MKTAILKIIGLSHLRNTRSLCFSDEHFMKFFKDLPWCFPSVFPRHMLMHWDKEGKALSCDTAIKKFSAVNTERG